MEDRQENKKRTALLGQVDLFDQDQSLKTSRFLFWTEDSRLHTVVFTGKEKDSETGFYNFGARYYDSDLSGLFLSVDPMADKYPGISPYHYCHWNPINLMDPNGEEDVDDWYKDEKGQLRWDSSVKKDTPLKNREEYLGETVLLTDGNDQTIYGDEKGQLHTSVQLPSVTITGEVGTTEKEANIALPITLGTAFLENLSTFAEAVVQAVVDVAWMIPACILLSGDSSPNQDIRGGHDNNVRKSTKSKHESGDRRRIQDQQGSKGEHIVKGKRPKGYKGPWPSKKKK